MSFAYLNKVLASMAVSSLVWVCLAMSAQAASSPAEKKPIEKASIKQELARDEGQSGLNERYDIIARSQDIRLILNEFGALLDRPVVLSDAVSGTVSFRALEAKAEELLDQLTQENALVWRYDGRRIEVTTEDEQVSRAVRLSGVSPERLEKALKEVGLYDPKFPIVTVEKSLAVISGPPRYVALAEIVLAEIASENELELARKQEELRLKGLREEMKLRAAERRAIVELQETQRHQRLAEEARERRLREANRLPVIIRGTAITGG